MVVVERHLFKSKKYDVVVKLLSRLIAKGVASADEKYICALACQRLGRNEDAYKLLLSLQDCKYDIIRVQKSLADVLFALGHYVNAAKYYKMCLEREPENRRLVLCHSLALVNSGNVKDGLVDLFRLDYENDNDVDVKRIIAWGYLVNCKPNDAERVYDWIVNSDRAIDSDWLNCGYAKFILSKTAEAVRCFQRFVEQNEATDQRELLKRELANDWKILSKNGVKDYEAHLIVDIVMTK